MAEHVIIEIQQIPQLIVVYPNMAFRGYCEQNPETYCPTFALFVNGEFAGTPCGICATNFINEARTTNPSVDVKDYRYAILN